VFSPDQVPTKVEEIAYGSMSTQEVLLQTAHLSANPGQGMVRSRERLRSYWMRWTRRLQPTDRPQEETTIKPDVLDEPDAR